MLTFEKRMQSALELITGRKPTLKMIEAYFLVDGNNDLQEWVLSDMREGMYWMQGISVIDAAIALADQPCDSLEDCDYETLVEWRLRKEGKRVVDFFGNRLPIKDSEGLYLAMDYESYQIRQFKDKPIFVQSIEVWCEPTGASGKPIGWDNEQSQTRKVSAAELIVYYGDE